MLTKILDVINVVGKVTLQIFKTLALGNKQNEKINRINKYNTAVDGVFVDSSDNNKS